MNKCIEIGRIATDIDIRTTQSGLSVASFKIAVNKRAKNAQGGHDADFFPVTVWRQTADFLKQYAKKGDRVAVCGTLQTRSYDAQDGTKRYITEINAEEVELFGDRRNNNGGGNGQAQGQNTMQQQGFVEVDEQDDSLPF